MSGGHPHLLMTKRRLVEGLLSPRGQSSSLRDQRSTRTGRGIDWYPRLDYEDQVNGIRIITASWLAMSLTGCSSEALPYRNPLDRLMVGLRLNELGYHACGHSVVEGGIEVIEPIPAEQCYRFGPRMRMRGLWLCEFEGSEFVQNAVEPPDSSTFYPNGTWLAWTQRAGIPCRPYYPYPKEPTVFAIDFVGRLSAYPGRYGHLGGSRNLVLVDKLLSIRRLNSSSKGEVHAR
jgi:hypothetical protein